MAIFIRGAAAALLLLAVPARGFAPPRAAAPRAAAAPLGLAASAEEKAVATPRATPPDATAATIAAFDRHVLTTYGRYPLSIVSGRGCELTSAEGRTYLDFVAGISTCALGHAHPALARAVGEQMNTLTHVSNLYYIPQQGELARWLTDSAPSLGRAFFCNSGAEANEAALKLARKHAFRTRGVTAPTIITAEQSFHGRTMGALSATGQPKYRAGFGDLVPGFDYVRARRPPPRRARRSATPSSARRARDPDRAIRASADRAERPARRDSSENVARARLRGSSNFATHLAAAPSACHLEGARSWPPRSRRPSRSSSGSRRFPK